MRARIEVQVGSLEFQGGRLEFQMGKLEYQGTRLSCTSSSSFMEPCASFSGQAFS